MQSLYRIPASIRNHPLWSISATSAVMVPLIKQETLQRLFGLLVPALLGSLIVASWLSTQSSIMPAVPRPERPEDNRLRISHNLSAVQPKPPATPTTIRTRPDLLPTPAALDELFDFTSHPKTVVDPDESDTLPVPIAPIAGLSPLEIHIHEMLLTQLEPKGLRHDQKRLFARNVPTGHPIPFLGITSPFGMRFHPTRKQARFHPGVDLQAPMNTRVTSTADGVVEFAGTDNGKFGMTGLGQVISIHHNFGFNSTYGHLNRLLVKAGDFVRKGQPIALSGNSGITTAPHLHYEVRFIHHYLNPTPFMEWTPERQERLFREKGIQWITLLEHLDPGSPPHPVSARLEITPPESGSKVKAQPKRTKTPK